MRPFFSIITPIYNCEKYIRKCIESVQEQTYTSWELILIDDGSTDASGKICDTYCTDPRIRVIHQKNVGAFRSRIRGMEAANGEYELGLDADDYFDKNCLEVIKKAIDVSGCDLIFFGYRYVGKQQGSVRCSLEAGKKYSKREILKEVIENTNHCLWNKAIKTDRIKQARYYMPKAGLSINLDYIQVIPILCNVTEGYVINDILYNYRIYGSSISHSCKRQHIYDTEIVTRGVLNVLRREGLLDKELRDLVYLAYLKMIGPRLRTLFAEQKITREDCKKIHQSTGYKKSKKMERLGLLSKRDFKLLKLFRYKQYWALKLLTKMFL